MPDANLPEPLVPPEIDLRDYFYMPLDVVRLRDSHIALTTSGDEFRCAVLLWCVAWHQVPASSLPDDDVVLAQYAGLGRDVKEWKRLRKGALHGFVLCSDGRLYHPVIADKARDAWEQKREREERKAADRKRKKVAKGGAGESDPSAGIPSEFQRNTAGIPAHKGEEKKEEDRKESGNDDDMRGRARETPPVGESGGAPLAEPMPPEPQPPDIWGKEILDGSWKTQICPDWQPNAAGVAYARNAGMDDCRIAENVADFIKYNRRKKRWLLDWDSAWRSWVDHANEFDRPSRPSNVVVLPNGHTGDFDNGRIKLTTGDLSAATRRNLALRQSQERILEERERRRAAALDSSD
jgi:hypothetical protein